MSSKTGKRAAKRSMAVAKKKTAEKPQPIGLQISQENWGEILNELSVFKKVVVDSVIAIINKNSSPIFPEK